MIDEINKRAKKHILIVAIVGAVILIADMIMAYTGSDVKIISSHGQLYMLRPVNQEEPAHISMRAKIKGENESFEKMIDISLAPYNKKKQEEANHEVSEPTEISEKEQLQYEIRSAVNDFNSDSSLKKVRLPTELRSGAEISWKKENSNNSIAIISVILIVMAIIYKTRFAAIEKRRKEESESVIRQLPEFVNRLVLLLNAGLVLNSAFEKSVEESLMFKTWEKDYFYRRMKDIYTSVKTANGSMYREFRSFAKESGIKELMRISNIINDNVSKGVELTSKLQNESEVLWVSRKRNCEERGRLAETKLTLPLVIFLMVLVVITVAPALLEL